MSQAPGILRSTRRRSPRIVHKGPLLDRLAACEARLLEEWRPWCMRAKTDRNVRVAVAAERGSSGEVPSSRGAW